MTIHRYVATVLVFLGTLSTSAQDKKDEKVVVTGTSTTLARPSLPTPEPMAP